MASKFKFDRSYLVPAVIIGAAGVLLLAGLLHNGDDKSKVSARSARAQEAVNKHLARTAEQLEIQRRRMQIESSKLALTYLESQQGKRYEPPREGAELLSNDTSEMVARDLGVDKVQPLPANPMDLIHHQIFEEQSQRHMSEAFKREYARQFIENARRGGYEIRLSDDFRVLSVKPIRRPSWSN